MRDVDTSMLASLQARELRPFALLDMELAGEHYRYTDCDVPQAVGGVLYQPCGLEIGMISRSAGRLVDRVRVRLSNLDEVMTALFVGTDLQGQPATLSAVVVDAYGAMIGSTALELFSGDIDDWNLNERSFSLSIVSELARWSQRTLSRHPASCRWKRFKGSQCGYTGDATWCDRSYARCLALANQANYGGFRFLPDLADKEIWWGRKGGA